MTERFVLEGSNRSLLPGSEPRGKPSPDELIDITIRLRSRAGDLRPIADSLASVRLRDRSYLSRDDHDYDRRFGADPDVLNAILRLAEDNGFESSVAPNSSRTIRVKLPAGKIKEFLGTDVAFYVLPDGEAYRGREGEISFPPVLPLHVGQSIQGVFGLDDRRQAEPFVSVDKGISATESLRLPSSYDLPTDLDGQGQCVGVLEFGATFGRRDFAAIFGVDVTSIQTVTLRGVSNIGQGLNSKLEIGLDLKMIYQAAPKASLVFYFAPWTEQGWIEALDAAIHDKVYRPGILSLSWGWLEGGDSFWTENGIDTVDELLAEASLLGMTICAASGDRGPYLDASGRPRVVFPASSSYSLACGGTMIKGNEVVWNDDDGHASGGGVSQKIARPNSWQPRLPLAISGTLPTVTNDGRLLPDVASMSSSIFVNVNGSPNCVSGTSAAAPLWAGLVACANQKLEQTGKKKTAGQVNALIYQPSFSRAVSDVTRGVSGTPGYSADRRWDACTGWGTPIGREFVKALLESA
jgi:kumamolisin